MADVALGFIPGTTVIVTGAGSGIGRATAVRAAELGLSVAAWDLNTSAVDATVRDIESGGGHAIAITADVTSDDAVAAALETSAAALGEASYLVNNAGPASAHDMGFERGLTISVGSMRRVASSWLDRPRPQSCAMVNVSSVAGNLIGTSPDWYPASKAAIMGWTRHLAAYRTDDVRANAVAPGMTDTPRLAGFADSELGHRIVGRIPLHRMGTPDEIAWAILFLLSPLASYVNGVLLTVDGGWTVTQ